MLKEQEMRTAKFYATLSGVACLLQGIIPAHAANGITMTTPGGPQQYTIGWAVGSDGTFENSDWYSRFTLKSHKTGGSARTEDGYETGAFNGTWSMGWNTTGLTSGEYTLIAYLDATTDMGQTYFAVGQQGQSSLDLTP
jgi:hypothetical protein